MAFSIIIPHRDDLRGLQRTLAALASGRIGRSAFDITVVDNASHAGMAAVEAVVRRFDLPVRIIGEAAVGAAPARNRGVACSTGERLVFLDCDSEPDAGWLDDLAAGLDRHDVVGGPVRVRLPAGDPRAANSAELFDLLFGFNSERSFARDGFLLTANLATTRAVFDAVGPFRTAVSEDREWCVRARASGFRVALLPTAGVDHHALDDVAALDRRWARVTRESFAFHRHQGRSRIDWLGYSLAVGVSPLAHAARVVASPALRGVSVRRRADVLRLLATIRLRRSLLGLGLLLTPPA